MRVRPDQIQALRDAQEALAGLLEGKVRHVATSAGVARYGKPLGAPIDGSPPVMYVPPRMLTREQADRVGRSWVYPSGKDTISRSLRTWLDTGQDRAIPALRRVQDVRDDDTVLTVGQLIRTVTRHGERKTTYRGLVMEPDAFQKMIENKQFDEPLGTSTTVQDLAWRFAQGDFVQGRLPQDEEWISRYKHVVMVLDGPALRLPNDNEGMNDDLGFNPEEHWVSGRYEITGVEDDRVTDTVIVHATWQGALKPRTRKSTDIMEYEYDPSLDFDLWRCELTWPDGETKGVRHVRDSAYWGAPTGTPLPLAHRGGVISADAVPPSVVQSVGTMNVIFRAEARDRLALDPDTSLFQKRLKASVAQRISRRMSDVSTDDLINAAVYEENGVALDYSKKEFQYALGELTGKEPLAVMLDNYGHITTDWAEFYGLAPRTDGSMIREHHDLLGRNPALAGTPEAEQLVRESCIGRLIKQWAGTSNDDSAVSLAMQDAAAEEFGIDGAAEWGREIRYPFAKGKYLKRNKATLRTFLRAQYDETQEMLKRNGITGFTAYRGYGIKSSESLAAAIGEAGGPIDAKASMRPLSSWSTDPAQAVNFMRDWDTGMEGIMVKTVIPANRVLSSAVTGNGCWDERELVVLGGPMDVQAVGKQNADVWSGVRPDGLYGDDPEFDPAVDEDPNAFDPNEDYWEDALMEKSLSQRPVINCDDSLRNSDWIKTLSWDLPDTDDAMARTFGVDWREMFAHLPAWEAAPDSLKSESKTVRRRVKDPVYWGMPMGTPIRPGMKPVINVPNTSGTRTLSSGREWGHRTKSDLLAIYHHRVFDTKRKTPLSLDMMNQIMDRYAQEMDEVEDAWQSPTGALVTIKDVMDDDEVERLLEAVDVLDMLAPTDDRRSDDVEVVVDSKEIESATRLNKHGYSTLNGLCSSWGHRIVINPDVMSGEVEEDWGNNFHPRSSSQYPQPLSTLAHEWGHSLNPEHYFSRKMSRQEVLYLMGDWSEYGQTNTVECIAEGFSEWFLTGGKTDIPQVQKMAALLDWERRFPRVKEFTADHKPVSEDDNPEVAFEADWLADHDENWINDSEVTP